MSGLFIEHTFTHDAPVPFPPAPCGMCQLTRLRAHITLRRLSLLVSVVIAPKVCIHVLASMASSPRLVVKSRLS